MLEPTLILTVTETSLAATLGLTPHFVAKSVMTEPFGSSFASYSMVTGKVKFVCVWSSNLMSDMCPEPTSVLLIGYTTCEREEKIGVSQSAQGSRSVNNTHGSV